MDAAQFQRVGEIFERARILSGDERSAYLADACSDEPKVAAEVRRLLALHEESGALEEPELQDAAARREDALRNTLQGTDEHPDRVGPYRIEAVLGEGGMGVVYRAEQDAPLRRTVALKLIRLGMNSRAIVARFELERQMLAVMNHPGIAQVYDAGIADDGRPFFAMEFVAGEPVTAYCDRNELSTPQRLALILQICDALQHAHQKGVVHRDIKPSNVLVGEVDGKPVPKIIDFGIARATDRQQIEQTLLTEVGQVVGTPAYMSPEQAALDEGDIDTRTDIYSLGVLLYELLVGVLPFDPKDLLRAGLAEMQRVIQDEDARRPSTRFEQLDPGTSTDAASRRNTDRVSLIRSLRGDLDWITLKALEKDRDRRYASVNGLSEDIRRYLGNEPVEARPPSTRYRIGKFVRRNKGAVAAAALTLGSLIVGLIVSLNLFVTGERARQLAEERLAKAQRLADAELYDTLVADAEIVWPARPDRIPRFDAWIAKAQDLASRLPSYVAQRDALRKHSAPGGIPTESARRAAADLANARSVHRAEQRAIGEQDVSTVIAVSEDGSKRPVAYTFTHSFDVAEPISAGDMAIRIRHSGGVLVKLNDVEVLRRFVPKDPVTADTLATGVPSGATIYYVPSKHLRVGENAIEVAFHLRRRDQRVMHFGLGMVNAEGETLIPFDARWSYRARDVSGVGKAPLGYWDAIAVTPEMAYRRTEANRSVELARVALAQAQAAFDEQRARTFEDRALQEEHDELDRVVLAIESLTVREPKPGLLPKMIAGRQWATSVRAETIDAHREAWDQAIAAIATSPKYGGLQLRPQPGLIPLGPDPVSGLWEFAHPASGPIVARASEGHLLLAERMGMVFVLIPGGSFHMGAQRPTKNAPSGPNIDPDAHPYIERPVQEVRLPPFLLSKYEMTQAQWFHATGNIPSSAPPSSSSPNSNITERNPVEMVSWIDCTQVMRRFGLALPTEAQWEYAARAGTSTRWWTGSDPKSLQGAVNLNDRTARKFSPGFGRSAYMEIEDGSPMGAQVGTYKPNAFGLHEMLGNVREWCRDSSGTYAAPYDPRDGLRMEFFRDDIHIVRGGSFSGQPRHSRVARRGREKATTTSMILGLRPARALAP